MKITWKMKIDGLNFMENAEISKIEYNLLVKFYVFFVFMIYYNCYSMLILIYTKKNKKGFLE